MWGNKKEPSQSLEMESAQEEKVASGQRGREKQEGVGRTKTRTEHMRFKELLSLKTEIIIEPFYCSDSGNPTARGWNMTVR